jgi:hypothetical protein
MNSSTLQVLGAIHGEEACLPARENDPTGLLQALHPLRRLAEAGISFLLAHHTRKAYSEPPWPPAARSC